MVSIGQPSNTFTRCNNGLEVMLSERKTTGKAVIFLSKLAGVMHKVTLAFLHFPFCTRPLEELMIQTMSCNMSFSARNLPNDPWVHTN